ncbi:MAG: tetratricopeptide repeat protein [Verrucomicrobiota bacterium]
MRIKVEKIPRIPASSSALTLMAGAWCLALQFFVPPVTAAEEEKAHHIKPEAASMKTEASVSIQKIRAAVHDGLFDLSLRMINRAFREKDLSDEERQEAVILLLQSFYKLDRYKDIIETIESSQYRAYLDGAAEQKFWLAMAYHGMGDCSKALSLLADFVESYPESPRHGDVIRLKSCCYLEMDKVEKAIRTFNDYASGFTKDPDYCSHMLEWAKMLIEKDVMEPAGRILAMIQEAGSTNRAALESRYWLARMLIDDGELVKASEYLDQVAASDEVGRDIRARALYSRAIIHGARDETGKAERALREANKLAVDEDLKRKGHYELGAMLLRMNEVEEAVPLLRSYISAYPGNEISRLTQLELANALASGGKNEEAIDEFTTYLETFTNAIGRARAYEGKGWSLMELGRQGEAAKAFEKASGLYTQRQDKVRCVYKMSDAYMANGQYDRACAGYSRIPDQFPGSELEPRARFQIAQGLFMRGHIVEAEETFARLVEKYPEHQVAAEASLRVPELKLKIARDAEEEGRRSDATRGYHEAIDGFESFMNSYTNRSLYAAALHGRGVARYRLFWFRKALDDFERSVAEFPDQEFVEQSFYMRGMCWYGMVQDKKALKIWHDFVKKYPDSAHAPEVLFWAAKTEYNRGEFPAAQEHFVLIADKYGTSSRADDALLWAARAAVEEQEFVRANELLTRLIKAYPKSDRIAEARFEQGDTLSALGEFGDAILIFDEIINKFPDSDLVPAAWGRKGDCQFALGSGHPKRYEESIESFRMAANKPGASRGLVLQAEYKIGRSLEKLGLKGKAFEQYYLKVILPYLEEREKGVWHGEAPKVWFSRAAFNAAQILEEQEKWQQAISVLERVVSAGVPTADDAREKIEEIRDKHWWVF